MINDFLTYLLESTVCYAIMYSFYKYVFYQSTHFSWNRWYFYLSVIISLIIPILPFPFSLENHTASNNLLMISPADGTGLMVFSAPVSFWSRFDFLTRNPYLNLNNVLMAVYFSGLARYLIVFIRKNINLFKLIQSCEIQPIGNYKLAIHKSRIPAFSWFKYIFINKQFLTLETHEQVQIIEHEKIHARQNHSLDVILFEILEIVFWFNPLVTKSKQTLKNIHEFIVDSVIAINSDAGEYSKLLVKLSVAKPGMSQISLFAKNPLRDRIFQLAFPTSVRLRKLRFISGIPLLIAVLICYSFIISEINRTTEKLQFIKNDNFEMPVKGNYQIASLFFVKKPLSSNNIEYSNKENYQVLISHPEISFSTESFDYVFATKNGTVQKIDHKDNWGIDEIEIQLKHNQQFTSIYKGLEKSMVAVGDIVEKGQIVGQTGDNRLYPTISFQLLKNSVPVDPFLYIRK